MIRYRAVILQGQRRLGKLEMVKLLLTPSGEGHCWRCGVRKKCSWWVE